MNCATIYSLEPKELGLQAAHTSALRDATMQATNAMLTE